MGLIDCVASDLDAGDGIFYEKLKNRIGSGCLSGFSLGHPEG
jgi:hypothetical protein